ncbi:MAG: DUF6477 family protein [Pseudomonadota bacterium]
MTTDMMTTPMTGDIFPLSRPGLLARTAHLGARLYRRERDLPGAIPGLLARPEAQILPRLAQAEARCEDERRRRAPEYRPGRHVQILSALLAEAAAAG